MMPTWVLDDSALNGAKDMKEPKILLVDDDSNILRVMQLRLSLMGFDVTACNDPHDALSRFKSDSYVLAITDQRMEGISGMDLMDRLHTIDPLLPVIIMTAYASVEDAVRSVHKGAYTYLRKPVSPEELETCISKALEKRRLEAKLTREREIWVKVIDSLGAGIILVDSDMNIIWANERVKNILNFDSNFEIDGKSCSEIFAGKGLPCMNCPTKKALQFGEVCSVEHHDLTDDKWLLVTSTPVLDGAGNAFQAVELVVDITAHKRAQDALLVQERLKGALEMAGAAAHELNQPMQAILGWGELLQKKIEEGKSPDLKVLNLICEQVERLGEITSRITGVTHYVKVDYPGTDGILDLKKAIHLE